MVRRMNIWKEFWLFMLQNKVYWMAPIIIVLLLLAILLMFGGSAAAPFIYTLF